jgi:short-subunit dehydrogenase
MPERGRTLIVTGASSGIGHALSVAAARDGYRLAVVSRRADRLEALARSIRETGGACVTLAGDVTARDMPARIVATALDAFGRIDVVVNNAGGGAYGPLLEQSDAAIEAQWQLNVAAPLRLARAALPQLEKTRGQLVFLGSGNARVPLPHFGAYNAAKAAIRAAAIQLRRELGSRGIAVTYVDPGLVATEFHAAMGIRRTRAMSPASPQRVARAILRGIERRSAVVSGVPWQSAGTALGEMLGTLLDRTIVTRFTPQPEVARQADLPSTPSPNRPASFEKALEPVARRMERVKLSPDFLRDALVPGTTIELNAVAMRWAGMPNKNERAVLRDALNALQAAGYLETLEEGRWKVVRAAG